MNRETTHSRQTVSQPDDDGFYLPAEWCRHARTWVAWPTSSQGLTSDDVPFTDAVERLVKAVREIEPVTIIADSHCEQDVRNRIGGRVDIVNIPHESARIRDFGPSFLVDGKGGSAAID